MMKTSLLTLSIFLLSPIAACGQSADISPADVSEANISDTGDKAQAGERIAEDTPAVTTPEPPAATETAPVTETPTVSEPEAGEKNATRWGQNVDANGYEELAWEDLMPEGEEERLREMYEMQMQSLFSVTEGSAGDTATQFGTFNVVKELDGVKIKLPGYTVPFDFSPNAQIHEFLLVPYFGACLHAPPPPPNQTVYVKTDEAIKIGDLAQAVWIYGTLKTTVQTTDTADTAYTVILDEIEEYSY